ncbi:immunity 49 family protein [Streptomyces violascens]|uniref:immunity 49 family protein n=1 Tax=Streptomyces violascens TaxID=67381 RepID=UPI00379A3F9B
MVLNLPRHDFPTARAAEAADFLAASAGRSIDRIGNSPESFNRAFESALNAANARCVLDPMADKFDTWASWVTVMQVGSALFAAAVAPEGATIECRIGRESREITATGVQPYAHAGNWIKAFWLTVICREEERMTQLCRVPVSLLRASGAVFDEYIYAWVDALQTYWLRGEGLGGKLVAAVRGTDPATIEVADRELMLNVLYPPIEMFHLFVREERERFNVSLENAVRCHKEFWVEDEDRAISTDSLVALGPLAVACMAYDAGFPIEVESEYLPRFLLDRGWVGEFDT